MNLFKFIVDNIFKLLNIIKFKKISLVFKFSKKIDQSKKSSYIFCFKINKLFFMFCFFMI